MQINRHFSIFHFLRINNIHSMLNQEITNKIKLVLVGDGGVGKTTLFRAIQPQRKKTYPNLYRNYEFVQIIAKTSKGFVQITLCDTAGQQKLGGLRQIYYLNADGAFIIYDVTSRITFKNVPKWYKDINRVAENIPILILGNKIDLGERKVKLKHLKWVRNKNIKCLDVSLKCNYGINKSFELMLRKITRDENLQLLQPIKLKKAVKQIDSSILQLNNIERDSVQDDSQSQSSQF